MGAGLALTGPGHRKAVQGASNRGLVGGKGQDVGFINSTPEDQQLWEEQRGDQEGG